MQLRQLEPRQVRATRTDGLGPFYGKSKAAVVVLVKNATFLGKNTDLLRIKATGKWRESEFQTRF